MGFMKILAAREWLNDHPRIVEKIREEARQEALEEAAHVARELGKGHFSDKVEQAHGCYVVAEEILALKDTEE